MPEEEYFAKLEAEKKARLAAEARVRREREAQEARKALHFHKCGKCGADMETLAFKGVEIERCPSCGAVLLDPGELEQLAGADRSGVLHTLADMFSLKRSG